MQIFDFSCRGCVQLGGPKMQKHNTLLCVPRGANKSATRNSMNRGVFALVKNVPGTLFFFEPPPPTAFSQGRAKKTLDGLFRYPSLPLEGRFRPSRTLPHPPQGRGGTPGEGPKVPLGRGGLDPQKVIVFLHFRTLRRGKKVPFRPSWRVETGLPGALEGPPGPVLAKSRGLDPKSRVWTLKSAKFWGLDPKKVLFSTLGKGVFDPPGSKNRVFLGYGGVGPVLDENTGFFEKNPYFLTFLAFFPFPTLSDPPQP